MLGERKRSSTDASRLLDLEEERVVVATLEEDRERVEADAAHPHDLQRRVDQLVAVEQHEPILRDGVAVAGHAPTATELGVTAGRWVMTGGWSTIRR